MQESAFSAKTQSRFVSDVSTMLWDLSAKSDTPDDFFISVVPGATHIFNQINKEQTEKNDSGLTFDDFWALQRRLTLTGDPLQAGRQNVATIKRCITNLVKAT